MLKSFNLLLITFLLLAMATIGCSQGNNETNSKIMAYNFTLQDLNGKVHKLSDYRGKVVIVDIWDTWCSPCIQEIPHFIELHNKYQEKGFVMIGIAVGIHGLQAVQQFIQDYDVPYINLLGDEKTFKGFGDISGIPTTFVINKKGEIVKRAVGYKPKEFFESEILELL